MKIFSLIFLSSAFLIFPQAQQDSPELNEAFALTELSGMPIKVSGVIQYHFVRQ